MRVVGVRPCTQERIAEAAARIQELQRRYLAGCALESALETARRLGASAVWFDPNTETLMVQTQPEPVTFVTCTVRISDVPDRANSR